MHASQALASLPSVLRRESAVRLLERALVLIPVCLAVFNVVGFIVAGYFRATYAYPLEIMEVPSIQALRHIVSGAPLYGAPTLAYTPPIYAPLYFYVAALFADITGPTFTTLRLVSLLASLGTSLLIARMVYRETHSRLPAVVSSGLFVGTTSLAGNSLDLARVDALCVFLLVAALDAARAADLDRRRQLWFTLASGVLGGLAVLTKQTAIVIVVVLLVHTCATLRPRRIGAFTVGALASVGIIWLALSVQYGSWLQTYLIVLPRRHEIDFTGVGSFWSKQLLPAFSLPILLAGPLLLIGLVLRRDSVGVRFWLLAAIGLVGMSLGAWLNRFSTQNVLLPTYALLAMVSGLGLDTALRWLRGTTHARVLRAYVLSLVVVQFVVLQYNPRVTSPLRSDTWAGDKLVATLASRPGSVFGPDYAEFLRMAGKGDQAAGTSMNEFVGGFGGSPLPDGSALVAAYNQALAERRFDALLLDPQSLEFFLIAGARGNNYVDIGPVFPADDEFNLWGSTYVGQGHVWVPAERAGAHGLP